MRKKQLKWIGGVAAVAVAIWLLVVIVQAIGFYGLMALVAIGGGGAAGVKIFEKRKAQRWFDAVVLHVLKNDMSLQEYRALYRKLQEHGDERMSLVREVQVLRESMNLALNSKKRETAESRFALVVQKASVILEATHLLSKSVLEEIRNTVFSIEADFYTRLYVNAADGFCAKAISLKTNKSKLKYVQMARDALHEGLQVGRGDKELLGRAFRDAEHLVARLSVS